MAFYLFTEWSSFDMGGGDFGLANVDTIEAARQMARDVVAGNHEIDTVKIVEASHVEDVDVGAIRVEARRERAAVDRAAAETRERAEYERLRVKFGGNADVT